MRIDEVLIDLSWMLESRIDRALRDLIEHHAKRGLRGFLRNYLFGEMLADCFAFAIRVSGEIDCFGFFRGFLELGNDLLVVSFFRIGNELVSGFEIVFDIDSETFRRQIFNVAYRGLNQIVLSQILVYGFRLCRRFNDYQIFCHLIQSFLTKHLRQRSHQLSNFQREQRGRQLRNRELALIKKPIDMRRTVRCQ